MSKRIDKSWVVFASVENDGHGKCVDIFYRPDGTFGFEEFRRDVEDAGEWTPLGYYSGATYASSVAAYDAAESATPWLAEILRLNPTLRRHPVDNGTDKGHRPAAACLKNTDLSKTPLFRAKVASSEFLIYRNVAEFLDAALTWTPTRRRTRITGCKLPGLPVGSLRFC